VHAHRFEARLEGSNDSFRGEVIIAA
jgi:hypothetical protein